MGISEALRPQGTPHSLRRRRLTKLISEFLAFREPNQNTNPQRSRGASLFRNSGPSLFCATWRDFASTMQEVRRVLVLHMIRCYRANVAHTIRSSLRIF